MRCEPEFGQNCRFGEVCPAPAELGFGKALEATHTPIIREIRRKTTVFRYDWGSIQAVSPDCSKTYEGTVANRSTGANEDPRSMAGVSVRAQRKVRASRFRPRMLGADHEPVRMAEAADPFFASFFASGAFEQDGSTQMGVSNRPFVIAVALASSNAFASPIGYQTHMMVYGPGGYRFFDFVRVGVPMNLLLWVVAVVVLIPVLWPF